MCIWSPYYLLYYIYGMYIYTTHTVVPLGYISETRFSTHIQKKSFSIFLIQKLCMSIKYVYWSKKKKKICECTLIKKLFFPRLFSSLYGYLCIFFSVGMYIFCTKDSGKVIFYPYRWIYLAIIFKLSFVIFCLLQKTGDIFIIWAEHSLCGAAREIKIWKIKWLLIVWFVWGWWMKKKFLIIFHFLTASYCVTVVFIYLFFIVVIVEWRNEQSGEFMIKVWR